MKGGARMEKLIQEIMKDLECSREDAEEVAKMEIKAKGLKRYEQAEKPRKKAERERKVDEDKKKLLELCKNAIDDYVFSLVTKTETEISFEYNGEKYTLKLTKHRQKKE